MGGSLPSVVLGSGVLYRPRDATDGLWHRELPVTGSIQTQLWGRDAELTRCLGWVIGG